MDHVMDPYEQQLLSVFNSYDVTHRGSLDQESLQQLCNSLHLEERGVELVNCLLSDSKTHVTFIEFKDGLLTLLGNVQHSRQKLDVDLSDDSENEATEDREISPKFVFGSKKYGRRSRPESTEQIELFDHPDANLENNTAGKYENKPLKNVNKVQRSNSQSDVTHSRKRKTSGKLKRCTSFPGNHEMKSWTQEKHLKDTNIHLTVSEYYSSMLQSALEQLELGLDGYLNHLEIIRVCEFMGMHKLTKGLIKQLSGKDEADLNRSYTVEEFLEILQTTDDVFDDSSTISLNSTANNSCLTDDFGTKSLQYITLGPNGSGVISSQAVVELWENAGIVSATSLLQGLGFSGPNIDIADLATILDDELRSMNESRNDISYNNIINPHIILLQASIVLYQSEVKYLKSLLEQLTAERDKLRTDIADANHRASLLAQEVDDNHAKMEKRTQEQVRYLEQRHADMLKELTSQFLGEKEQLSGVNSKLETKIFTLEAEEARLRSDLQALQKYNNNLEKENNCLTNKLSDLEFERTSLTEKVGLLENECQKITEIERERDQLEPLLKKLSILQIENAELRDKNDELSTEVESLNCEMSAMRSKICSTPTCNIGNAEENVSGICEGVGNGLGAIKRRVDSPCKEHVNECGLETESPRLGKVRRCYQKNQPEVLLDALGTAASHLPPFNSSESGFEADLDCLDSSLSFTESDYSSQEEVSRLRRKISELEKELENVIKMPVNNTNKPAGECANDDVQDKLQYMKRCKQLELLLEGVQSSVTDMMKKKSECKDITDLFNPMSQLSDKLKNIALDSSSEESLNSTGSTSTVIASNVMPKMDTCTETDDSYVKIKEMLESKEKENQTLLTRCEDLELALDLLRNEFENCENYWAIKLDDERKLSEQDLKQSNEKLAELFIKISEYEQFAANDISESCDGRLSPIEEKGHLEQQFTELEEEYEDFKTSMETELEQRDQQIAALQLQLSEKTLKTVNETSVQVDLTEHVTENKITNLSNVIESTNIFSSETLPHAWQYPTNSQNSNSIDSSSSVINSNLSNIPERDYINPNLIWSKNDSVPKNVNVNENDEPFIESVCSTSTTNSISSIKSDMHTCSSLPPNISWQPPSTVPSPQPNSMNFIPEHNSLPLFHNNMSCRPKRARKHDRGIMTMSSRPQKKDQDMFIGKHSNYDMQNGHPRWHSFPLNGGGGDQTCVVPLNSIHHLHGRLRELDQHCRHLQFILKQQQRHSESVMHHCWQQNREEVTELQMHIKSLQEKLSRSDMLVKDLYVENTYLMANNQRLEHHCHMLIQCSSESTSV